MNSTCRPPSLVVHLLIIEQIVGLCEPKQATQDQTRADGSRDGRGGGRKSETRQMLAYNRRTTVGRKRMGGCVYVGEVAHWVRVGDEG